MNSKELESLRPYIKNINYNTLLLPVLKCYGTLGSMAEIKKVIGLVKKEVQKYENPVVTEIGDKSKAHKGNMQDPCQKKK